MDRMFLVTIKGFKAEPSSWKYEDVVTATSIAVGIEQSLDGYVTDCGVDYSSVEVSEIKEIDKY